MAKSQEGHKGGRQPGGPNGEYIQDYSRITLRLPPVTAGRLKAWSQVRHIPVWQLIDEAVNQCIDALKGDDARDVRTLARRHVSHEEAIVAERRKARLANP